MGEMLCTECGGEEVTDHTVRVNGAHLCTGCQLTAALTWLNATTYRVKVEYNDDGNGWWMLATNDYHLTPEGADTFTYNGDTFTAALVGLWSQAMKIEANRG